MSDAREVVVVSGVRTAIGDYGGSLKDIAPTELAAQVVREAVKRANVDPQEAKAPSAAMPQRYKPTFER